MLHVQPKWESQDGTTVSLRYGNWFNTKLPMQQHNAQANGNLFRNYAETKYSEVSSTIFVNKADIPVFP